MIRLTIGFFLAIASGGVVDTAPAWYILAIGLPGVAMLAWPVLDGTIDTE
jgi:hypothetical protein